MLNPNVANANSNITQAYISTASAYYGLYNLKKVVLPQAKDVEGQQGLIDLATKINLALQEVNSPS